MGKALGILITAFLLTVFLLEASRIISAIVGP